MENIFNELFREPIGGGYPKERAVSERNNREILKKVKNVTARPLLDSLKDIDKELIAHICQNEVFMKSLEEASCLDYLEALKR